MNEKGFSLIELLVAVLLLAIMAVSLMALFPTGYREITKAGRQSVMNHLAQKKIDELMASGYGSPDLTAGIHPTTYRLVDDPELYNYSIKWTVTDNPAIGIPFATKMVVVEVGYILYKTDNSNNNQVDPAAQQSETFVAYISQ